MRSGNEKRVVSCRARPASSAFLHCGIRFVSPITRHEGKDNEIFQKRHQVYLKVNKTIRSGGHLISLKKAA
jgi:hypothetical protein